MKDDDTLEVTIYLRIDRKTKLTRWRSEGFTDASSSEDRQLVYDAVEGMLRMSRERTQLEDGETESIH